MSTQSSGVRNKKFEINAGISHLVDGKLIADPRLGRIEIYRDQDDLRHFSWIERRQEFGNLNQTNIEPLKPDLDVVITPGTSATFDLIEGRRSWVMKYEGQQYFFWAQDHDSSRDRDIAAIIKVCLNAVERPGAVNESDDDDEEEEQDVRINALQARQLAQMLGSIRCPPQQPAAPAPAAPSASAPAVDARALAAALGSIASGQMQMQRAPGPNLADVLTPEVIIPLLREPGVLERLAPHLPEEHRNEAALMELAASAQLRHQLSVLGAALQTAQLDPSQFGLTPSGYTVADFLESIQKKVDEEGSADRQA